MSGIQGLLERTKLHKEEIKRQEAARHAQSLVIQEALYKRILEKAEELPYLPDGIDITIPCDDLHVLGYGDLWKENIEFRLEREHGLPCRFSEPLANAMRLKYDQIFGIIPMGTVCEVPYTLYVDDPRRR